MGKVYPEKIKEKEQVLLWEREERKHQYPADFAAKKMSAKEVSCDYRLPSLSVSSSMNEKKMNEWTKNNNWMRLFVPCGRQWRDF